MLSFNKTLYSQLLAQMESGNNYSAINSIGALGKYQFLPSTLNGLQFKYGLPTWISKDYFVSHPDMQENYFNAYLIDTSGFIDANNLSRYVGKVITGSKRFKTITASLNVYGLLAMLHLGSPQSVNNLLENGIDSNDGFTSLSDYAAFFSYNLKTTNLNYFAVLLAIIPGVILYYS